MKFSMEDSASALATICNWIHRFQNGRKSFEDHDCADRPVTHSRPENIKRIEKVLKDEDRFSGTIVENIVGLPDRIVHRVMTEHLEIRNVQERWASKLLSEEQKKTRLEISFQLLHNYQQDKEYR